VLGWAAKPPTRFGFATELWTSRRLAALIERRWGIRFNANYLLEWLKRPQALAPEARPAGTGARRGSHRPRWAQEDWSRLQKKPGLKRLTLS
jgi:Winged helix-turn helix